MINVTILNGNTICTNNGTSSGGGGDIYHEISQLTMTETGWDLNTIHFFFNGLKITSITMRTMTTMTICFEGPNLPQTINISDDITIMAIAAL